FQPFSSIFPCSIPVEKKLYFASSADIENEVAALMNDIRVEEAITAFLLDAIPAFVWSARTDTLELISVNQAFERIFKYPRARVLSEKKFWLSLIHPADRRTVLSSLKTAALHHSDCRFICRMRSADEEELWFDNFV